MGGNLIIGMRTTERFVEADTGYSDDTDADCPATYHTGHCSEFEEEFYIGNPELNSLNGLESLISVGGDLHIGANDSLISLSALESLETVGNSVEILSNTQLPTCEAGQILENLREGGLGNRWEIRDNNNRGVCE